jgi:hypothetical protein
MPHIQYFDRSGRPLSKREACEADGKTLRDGVSMRIPAHLADHAPRFSDGRSFWDAHRDSLLVVDAQRVGGASGCRPGFRVFDSDVGRAEREAAYAEADAYRRDAWRNPPRDAFGAYPYTAAAEGSACTVDGRPGRLVREGGVLVCHPISADARTIDEKDCPDCNGSGEIDGEACERCGGTGELDDDDNGETATSDRRVLDVNTISANHQRNMARLYDAHARELSEAWKGSK